MTGLPGVTFGQEGRCALSKRICPRTADPTSRWYCPAWWETVWSNEQGETKVERGCAFQQLPAYLNQFAKASSQASAAAVEAREATRQGLRAVALTLFSEGDLDAQAALQAEAGLEIEYAKAASGYSIDQGPSDPPGIRDHRAEDVPPHNDRLEQSRPGDDEPETHSSDRRSFDGWPTLL